MPRVEYVDIEDDEVVVFYDLPENDPVVCYMRRQPGEQYNQTSPGGRAILVRFAETTQRS